jgi:putative ABC transport system permease protein
MTSMWKGDDAEKKKSVFSFLTKQDDQEYGLVFPVVVSGDMQNTFPEIKSITRLKDEGGSLLKAKNAVFKEEHILYADDNFFTNFSFHLKEGNAKTILTSTKNIVLSETTAKKYFGKQDAIGKTIQFAGDSTQLYTVAGIAEDAPANSSIQYNVVIPLLSQSDYEENVKERFNHMNHLVIVELNSGVDAAQFEKKMNEWVKTYFVAPFISDYGKYYKDYDFGKYRWHLRPLADCHYNVSNPWGHYTDAKNIYQLVSLVIIILLIASLNYILLTISNAAARAQEVGVRKVMGANRKKIILQFWVETQIVVIIAVIVGLLLSQLFIPLFNSAINTQLNFRDISWKEILSAAVILSFLLGVIAGYYPALMISKMKPVSILKSFQTFKITPRFSKVLVVLQYTACVVFMIAAFVVNRQMQFINNKDLGFDKEQIIIVHNPVFDFDFSKRLRERLSDFAKTQPSIIEFSAMNGGLNGAGNHNKFKLNGEDKWLTQMQIDYNYFKILGLQFVQGRPFSEAITSDTSRVVRASVVNETLFNMLGKDAKLGVYNEAIRSTIIGVVKDYHFASLTQKIEPEQHVLGKFYFTYMFKIKAGQMQPAIAKIEKEWKTITNNYPFEYTFLDQTIAKMYEADMRWQKTIQASCFFAILIACMGLFGLSAINAINRRKEIGIRKVLGASVKDIVATLSSSFLIMVIISIAIATPLAWWLMNKWLEDFAYRINISWWMFLIIGITAIIIAIGTVSFQAIKAALANPVKSLRTE